MEHSVSDPAWPNLVEMWPPVHVRNPVRDTQSRVQSPWIQTSVVLISTSELCTLLLNIFSYLNWRDAGIRATLAELETSKEASSAGAVLRSDLQYFYQEASSLVLQITLQSVFMSHLKSVDQRYSW